MALDFLAALSTSLPRLLDFDGAGEKGSLAAVVRGALAYTLHLSAEGFMAYDGAFSGEKAALRRGTRASPLQICPEELTAYGAARLVARGFPTPTLIMPREQGVRVAPDAGGYTAYGMLRGLPDIQLARKPLQQWLKPPSEQSGMLVGDMTCDVFRKLAGFKTGFGMSTKGTGSYHDPNNSRVFVGCLDQSITDDDLLRAFSPYGELVNVKVLASKAWGFVTYSNRASADGSHLGAENMGLWGCRSTNKQMFVGCIGTSLTYDDPLRVLAGMSCGSLWPSAEEVMRMLNGSQLGGNAMKIWGHHYANKQYQQDGQNDGGYCFDPCGLGWSSPELGSLNDPMSGMVASMGTSLLLTRGFSGTGGGGGSGGLEMEFWEWVEQTYSKPFLKRLDSGLTGMGYDRPTGKMSRIFICVLAYSVLCQASKDWYNLYLLLVYGVTRHSPDNWGELAMALRPFGDCVLQHYKEEISPDFRGGWD